MASELKPFGYAPGSYMNNCKSCGQSFMGDKRAWNCEPCAKALSLPADTRPAPAATDTGLVTVKWPYQKTFNAIGAAVKIQGDAKAISVQAFIEAFGDELVTRSQAEELLAAKDRIIKQFQSEIILGFYEDAYPIYAQGYDGAGGCELADVATAKEVNGLVDKIKTLEADNAAKDAQIKELRDTSKQMIGNWRNRAETAEAKLETYHEEYENRKEGYEKTIDSLVEKLAAAEKALEPFADIADMIDAETEGMAETDELVLHFHDYEFAKWPVSLFRKARAVLGGKP